MMIHLENTSERGESNMHHEGCFVHGVVDTQHTEMHYLLHILQWCALGGFGASPVINTQTQVTTLRSVTDTIDFMLPTFMTDFPALLQSS